MKMSERLYWLRLDAAFVKRRTAKETHQLKNIRCEACLTNIPNYSGPTSGALCDKCLSIGEEGGCTRQKPLAITRSTLNESRSSL